MNESEFYDPERVAVLPMGLCYPGRGKSGDLPPRKECAPRWHASILAKLPRVKLTLLIGSYAQREYLTGGSSTLTENVRTFRTHLPRFFPLPHPSPRNRHWLAINPWFEKEALPELRRRVAELR
jgi:uracil-DNA glycosylase